MIGIYSSVVSGMAEDRMLLLLSLVCLCSSAIASTLPDNNNQCEYNGNKYEHGEIIYDDECNSLECSDSGELVWSNTSCPETCDSNSPQDPCCPPCQATSTTPPETTQMGCEYDGTFYPPGQVIYSGRCDFLQCSDTGNVLIYGDLFCAEVCDPYSSPKECCPSCHEPSEIPQETTQMGHEYSDTIYQDTTTTNPFGCWYQGTFYQPGEDIYDDKCYLGSCSESGELLLITNTPCPPVCDSNYPQNPCCPCETTPAALP